MWFNRSPKVGRSKSYILKRRRKSEWLRFARPQIESLESRMLLAADVSTPIVVGRTLSSYLASEGPHQEIEITYTVYNPSAEPISGVLLTDTLQSGVTFEAASQLPDRNGQELAWSLGTIRAFDRTSVSLTVSLPDPPVLQLDGGARAFAMFHAGLISDEAPPAILTTQSIDSELLASTPDANITDPFVQQAAALQDYDPDNIFAFLHDSIDFNSYVGSVRGSRGVLWSLAGNSLDTASLGVALMRASGIPAQYAQGTLSPSQSQQLILSMFPEPFQLNGYIPAGSPVSDPANDPNLLAETQTHYWFQFDSGNGMTDADPLMGATPGQTFTAPTGTFAEVPDNLRERPRQARNAAPSSRLPVFEIEMFDEEIAWNAASWQCSSDQNEPTRGTSRMPKVICEVE